MKIPASVAVNQAPAPTRNASETGSGWVPMTGCSSVYSGRCQPWNPEGRTSRWAMTDLPGSRMPPLNMVNSGRRVPGSGDRYTGGDEAAGEFRDAGRGRPGPRPAVLQGRAGAARLG